MTIKILIVEDEVKISRFLQLELTYEGYSVDYAFDGREALNIFDPLKYDLVILDIMLPKINGIEVLRKIRKISDIPIIMLTAKDDISDKITGLDLGADDYITKPFSIEELLARIRVSLRHNTKKAHSSKTLTFNALKLDTDSYNVTYDNIQIDLTKTEFELLKYLMENKNIVLTREKIITEVWGYDYNGETNIVDVYIRYLRNKIDDRFNKKIIYTIRGVGYTIKDEKKY